MLFNRFKNRCENRFENRCLAKIGDKLFYLNERIEIYIIINLISKSLYKLYSKINI